LLLKGLGQSLGNAFGLILIEVRTLAQLAGRVSACRTERQSLPRLAFGRYVNMG